MAALNRSGEVVTMSRIDCFEGLRGFLALTVCVGHLGLNTLAGRFGITINLGQAVAVFFALSGFVMARAYYVKRRNFAALMVGRVARLYPLHALTLMWMLALTLGKGELINTEFAVQSFFLIHNLGLAPNIWALNFPSWSVSVEFAVSLLFFLWPVGLYPLMAGSLLVTLGTALCVGVAAADLHPAQNVFAVVNLGLLSGIGWFAIGYGAFLLARQLSGQLRRFGALTPIWFMGLIPLFVVTQSVGSTAIFCLVVLATLVFGAVNDGKTFLGTRPFVFLGGISYSIYLLHMPVYWTFEVILGEQAVRGLLGKSIVIASILGLSTLSYYYFELPAKRALSAIWPRRHAIGRECR